MREVVPGVFEWSWFSSEKQLDLNGHYVVEGDDRVLIDPPTLSQADRAEIDRRGGVTAIVLTNRDHLREIASCHTAFGAPVWAPAADADQIDVKPDHLFRNGDRLPGGLVAVAVPDSKSPGETALWAPARRALIVGDAVIGKPAGALNLLPDDKFADPKKARAGLSTLLAPRLDYDAVLVGDGASLTTGGRAALARLAGAA